MEIETIFATFGILGLAGVVFTEISFLPAFFLPGDTLLFSAGYLVHDGLLPLPYAVFSLSLAAFLGSMLAYYFGYFSKRKIEDYAKNKGESYAKGFERTKRFYNKYGLLTLFFGRFVPVVRTVAPFLAGVMKLPLLPYTIISFLSAFLWVTVGLALGAFFGRKLPNFEYIVILAMIIATVVSLIPVVYPYVKRKLFRKKEE